MPTRPFGRAANDNSSLSPSQRLFCRLWAVETFEIMWGEIYAPDRRNELDARRDWRKIQKMKAEAYRPGAS